MNKVSRFEVIDKNGRAIVVYAENIEYSFQDDNQTLKVFLKEDIQNFIVKSTR